MRIARVIAVLTVCTFLYSCSSGNNPFGNDDYETVTHGGQLYVLNKRTGQMYLVEDDRLRRITQPSTDRIFQSPKRIQFTEPFGREQLFSVTGIAKQVGDSVMIRGLVRPYFEELRQADRAIFTLHLAESDQFVLGEVVITGSELTHMIAGENIEDAWSFERSVDIPVSQFAHVSSVDVTWRLGMDNLMDEWLETENGAAWQERRITQNASTNLESDDESLPQEAATESTGDSSAPEN